MPEKTFLCSQCNCTVTSSHRFSARCLQNQIWWAVGDKLPDCKKRGLRGDGNLAQHIRNSRAFQDYLSFVRLTEERAQAMPASRVTYDFVPGSGAEASDVALMVAIIRCNLLAAGIHIPPTTVAETQVVLATCAITAIGNTTLMAAMVGTASVPGTRSYLTDLLNGFVEAYDNGKQMFNTGIQNTCCLSVCNLPRGQAIRKLKATTAIIRALLHRISELRYVGFDTEGICYHIAVALGGRGIPSFGFTMTHCVQLLRLTVARPPNAMPRVGDNEIIPYGRGLVKALSRITGYRKDLFRSPAFTRYQLGVVSSCMSRHAGCAGTFHTDPFLLATNLCQWSQEKEPESLRVDIFQAALTSECVLGESSLAVTSRGLKALAKTCIMEGKRLTRTPST